MSEIANLCSIARKRGYFSALDTAAFGMWVFNSYDY
jgi:hypothetical protein